MAMEARAGDEREPLEGAVSGRVGGVVGDGLDGQLATDERLLDEIEEAPSRLIAAEMTTRKISSTTEQYSN